MVLPKTWKVIKTWCSVKIYLIFAVVLASSPLLPSFSAISPFQVPSISLGYLPGTVFSFWRFLWSSLGFCSSHLLFPVPCPTLATLTGATAFCLSSWPWPCQAPTAGPVGLYWPGQMILLLVPFPSMNSGYCQQSPLITPVAAAHH